MRASDLAEYIDLSRRDEIIAEVFESADIEKLVWKNMKEKGLLPGSFVALPRELWGVVPLIIEAEGANGDTTQFIEANEATMREFGEYCAPGLLAVDHVLLDSRTAQMLASYLTAYADYMIEEVNRLSRKVEKWKFWCDKLVGELMLAYYPTVSEAMRKRLVKIDPAVLDLEALIATASAERDGYKNHIKYLDAKSKNISRDLERVKLNAQIDGRRGFDLGMSVYNDVEDAPPRRVGMRRGRK